MAVSDGFKEYVREQLEQVTTITMRSMFGGIGIYTRGTFFALVADDVLYFKVDDSNRADFEDQGMRPFRPFGDERLSMQYYEVPAEVLEVAEELGAWVGKSVSAALNQAAKQKRGRRKSGTGKRRADKRKSGSISAAAKARNRGGRRKRTKPDGKP